MGPEARTAVPALVLVLREDTGFVARDAVEVLAHLGPEATEAVPALVAARLQSDRFEEVSRALSCIDPQGVRTLALATAALKQGCIPGTFVPRPGRDTAQFRAHAAGMLGEMG